MSAGGHSLHQKDWLTLGATAGLAATGLGAAGIGPMAGLLSAGATAGADAAAGAGAVAPAIAEAGSAIPGASGAADLAGATGNALASTPSIGSPGLLAQARMGIENAGFNMGLPTGFDSAKSGRGLLRAATFANSLQPKPMQASGRPPQMVQTPNTQLYPQAGGGIPGIGQGQMDDQLKKWLAMQQGGY